MYILGLMSGTSLDGLDIAYCRFDDKRHFQLLAAETYPYPSEWRERLGRLHLASAEEYARTDVDLGHFFGEAVKRFRKNHPGGVDLIASHGHTVFHQPEKGFTAQIGDGNAIAAECGLPVVYDFRRLDVALGGQGAPLVPIGDRLLYGDYSCCINLGGIANISYEKEGERIAYDICPCNMALNHLARMGGQDYDRDGALASQGRVDTAIVEQMGKLDFYRQMPPKTLGKEWFETEFLPILQDSVLSLPDLMRSTSEHIATMIADAVKAIAIKSGGSVLITGGGARNTFLTNRIKEKLSPVTVTIPDGETIDYKEAIIFALLGFLRIQGETNTLASVTGASRDSIGGVVCGVV